MYTYTNLPVTSASHIQVQAKSVHLFLLSIERTALELIVNGRPIDLMRGHRNSTTMPSVKLTNTLEQQGLMMDTEESFHFDILSNGEQVAYVAKEKHLKDYSWNPTWHLYTVNIPSAGSGMTRDELNEKLKLDNENLPRSIFTARHRTIAYPRYSPDTTKIAFLVQRSIIEVNRRSLMVMDRETHVVESVPIDVSFAMLQWFPSSNGFLAEADFEGMHSLLTINYPNSDGTLMTSIYEGATSDATFIPNTWYILAKRHSFTSTPDFWRFETLLGGVAFYFMRLTNYNDQTFENVVMPPAPERFYFAGSYGNKIQGWLALPSSVEGGGIAANNNNNGTIVNGNKLLPVLVMLHDSGSSWISRWNFNFNPLLFTSAGYAVVTINYHGSSGYNSKTMNSTDDITTAPAQDLQMGLATILNKHKGILDENRICIFGISTWLTNYIHAYANDNNQFKCFVNYAGIFDFITTSYSTELQSFDSDKFHAQVWDEPELFEMFNPRRQVSKMKSPTLLIHGENDSLVSLTESLALFTALQRRSVPSQLLVFKGEGHWIENYSNWQQMYETVFAFLAKYL